MRAARHATLLACAAVISLATVAGAEERDRPFTEEPEALAFSVEGLGAALLPGSLVHGTGLWVRGDRQGARNLLRLEGLGLGVAALSGAVLGGTGASRRIASLTIPLLISGTGLFLQTWLADIYGSSGGGRRGARPSLLRAPLSLEAGVLAIHDPQFDYNLFGRLAARSWIGPLRVEPEALYAIDADNQRGRLDLAWRLWGPGARRRSGDGSYFELATGTRVHRYGEERFTAFAGELSAAGRLDFRRVGASLDGSFAELEVGYGIEVTSYKDADDIGDTSDMMLVRFAYGMYIGRPRDTVRGEASLYYDHRRDELAGGVSPGQQASGFLGHFGLGVDLDIGARSGVVGRFEIGSAAVGSLSLRYHLGSGARP